MLKFMVDPTRIQILIFFKKSPSIKHFIFIKVLSILSTMDFQEFDYNWFILKF